MSFSTVPSLTLRVMIRTVVSARWPQLLFAELLASSPSHLQSAACTCAAVFAAVRA